MVADAVAFKLLVLVPTAGPKNRPNGPLAWSSSLMMTLTVLGNGLVPAVNFPVLSVKPNWMSLSFRTSELTAPAEFRAAYCLAVVRQLARVPLRMLACNRALPFANWY